MCLTFASSTVTAGGVQPHPDSGRSQPGRREGGAQQPAERNAAECVKAADGFTTMFRFLTALLHKPLKPLTGCFSIFTELHKAKEAEKQVNSLKVSFEKLLQNERTLKIQVCVWAPTHVWIHKPGIHALFFASTFPTSICYISSSGVKNTAELQAGVEPGAKSQIYMVLPGLHVYLP